MYPTPYSPEYIEIIEFMKDRKKSYAWISILNVTFAVTFGFPSRSPPIQDPNLIGVHVNGRGLPVC